MAPPAAPAEPGRFVRAPAAASWRSLPVPARFAARADAALLSIEEAVDDGSSDPFAPDNDSDGLPEGFDPASFVSIDAFCDLGTAPNKPRPAASAKSSRRASIAAAAEAVSKRIRNVRGQASASAFTVQDLKPLQESQCQNIQSENSGNHQQTQVDAQQQGDCSNSSASDDSNDDHPTNSNPPAKQSKAKKQTESLDQNLPAAPPSSQWLSLGLHPVLAATLHHTLGFQSPSEIQSQTLPHALLHYRDVIGAAQTGSGKTLAFGLPILHHIASSLQAQDDSLVTTEDNTIQSPPIALILAPTRELAIQVSDHIRRAGQAIACKVVAVVGGMSIQKQRRLLASGPHIIVATPGRLWELLQEIDGLADSLCRIRFLVIDEADRMLEAGHFRDLDEILAIISPERIESNVKARIKRRTMVFSATILDDDAIKQVFTHSKKPKRPSHGAASSTFIKLLEKVSFRDPHPVYINLSTKRLTASGLLESKIDCLKSDKDLMLYYMICRYPGRTIVFVNSIDAIRRILSLLTILRVRVYGLHAEMQQRQRLKNLDRFRSNDYAVLVASDVAARGLDIPCVDHVIHYQLPRAADIYVHRSGRTARASSEGISVTLCSPHEMSTYKKLCHVLKKPTGMPDFPVDSAIMSRIRDRLRVAKEIDVLRHRERRVRADRDWLRKASAEADILLSDDDADVGADSDQDGDSSGKASRKRKKNRKSKANDRDDDDGENVKDSDRNVSILSFKERQKLRNLDAELNDLLGRPLIPKGISSKYLTGNVTQDLVDMILTNKNANMPTMAATRAVDDLRSISAKKASPVVSTSSTAAPNGKRGPESSPVEDQLPSKVKKQKRSNGSRPNQ